MFAAFENKNIIEIKYTQKCAKIDNNCNLYTRKTYNGKHLFKTEYVTFLGKENIGTTSKIKKISNLKFTMELYVFNAIIQINKITSLFVFTLTHSMKFDQSSDGTKHSFE